MTNALFSGAVPLLIFVAKATLLLLAATLATITLRRSTAGARHLVWLAALVGVVALPLLSRIPALRIGILPSIGATNIVPAFAPAATGVTPFTAPAAALAGPITSPSIAPAAPTTGIVTASSSTPTAAPAVSRDQLTPSFSLPASLLTTIAIAWAGVALSLVAWLIVGAVQVRRIVANGTELSTSDWTMPLCEVADRLDLEMPPRLVMSDRIEMAFACAALTPTIVLPEAAEQWTDERRRAVLFHELAHIKRHDLLGHTLGRFACALYWFHPLVWTAAKNLRNESERACDDLVLSCGALPSEYAQHLLDMVTSVRHHGAPVMALPMARKKEFEGRMLAILDPAIRRSSPGRMQSALVVASLSALSLTVAAVAPARVASASPTSASFVANEAPTRKAPLGAQLASSHASKLDTVPAPRARGAADAPVLDSVDIADVQARTNAAVNGAAEGVAKAVTSAVGRATSPGLLGTLSQGEFEAYVRMAAQSGSQQAVSILKELNRERPAQADSGRIAMLIKVLSTDTDASVRRSAAWALQDIQTPGTKSSLLAALKSDADARVREMSAWALADHESDDVAAALANALVHDKSDMVRRTSAWALGQMARRGQTDALITGTSDANAGVRELSIWALGQHDLHRAPPTLVNALSDNEPRIRTIAAWALGEIADSSSARAIIHAFETETDGSVKIAELHALSELDATPASVVDAAMKSNDPELRRRGVEMLAGHSGGWPWPWPWPWPRPSP
ncbi:MAG TPA: HEAT repeat domain-containing protein [Gemmatimonadaceae bacterium]|jgi:beta-lactamase regulating signal transducer with metallopeptidase domain/HEAT repeat protein